MHEGVTEGASEGSNQHLRPCADAEVLGNLAKAYGGVRSDARLFVV